MSETSELKSQRMGSLAIIALHYFLINMHTEVESERKQSRIMLYAFVCCLYMWRIRSPFAPMILKSSMSSTIRSRFGSFGSLSLTCWSHNKIYYNSKKRWKVQKCWRNESLKFGSLSLIGHWLSGITLHFNHSDSISLVTHADVHLQAKQQRGPLTHFRSLISSSAVSVNVWALFTTFRATKRLFLHANTH